MHASFVTRSVSEENTAFLSLLAHASGYETDCFTKFQRYTGLNEDLITDSRGHLFLSGGIQLVVQRFQADPQLLCRSRLVPIVPLDCFVDGKHL
jgi:hypothetical protein